VTLLTQKKKKTHFTKTHDEEWMWAEQFEEMERPWEGCKVKYRGPTSLKNHLTALP